MDNNIRRGAMALIVKGNKILMGKKGNRPGHFLNNAWHFPGGKAEGDEQIEETILREMKEELGMNIKIIKRLCEYTLTIADSQSHNTVFICESNDTPVPGDDLVDAHYFDYDDILKLRQKDTFERLPNEVKDYLTTFKAPETV